MLTDDMITAAADWWTTAIERPKFDNGDDSNRGGMAMAMAMLGNKPKTDADLEKFRTAFITRLKAEAEADRAPRILSVDYGPDMWLSDVATDSGIGSGITDWPWKTSMYLSDGKVTVRAGYGAEPRQIFPVQSEA